MCLMCYDMESPLARCWAGSKPVATLSCSTSRCRCRWRCLPDEARWTLRRYWRHIEGGLNEIMRMVFCNPNFIHIRQKISKLCSPYFCVFKVMCGNSLSMAPVSVATVGDVSFTLSLFPNGAYNGRYGPNGENLKYASDDGWVAMFFKVTSNATVRCRASATVISCPHLAVPEPLLKR